MKTKRIIVIIFKKNLYFNEKIFLHHFFEICAEDDDDVDAEDL